MRSLIKYSCLANGLDRLFEAEIPTVLLACKSDPDIQLEVEAGVANSLAEPFNIGLIEVTESTTHGKGKMRSALRWLLHKLEQQRRMQ